MREFTRQRAHSLIELLIVLSMIGILMAIAIPRSLHVLDRIAVHSAAGDVAATLSAARTLALAGQSAVAVHVDAGSGLLRVQRGPELVLTRNIGEAHGVALHGTRDSLAFDGWGLGAGAANLSITVRRRAAAETVFVSRLGRVR
ncbi:MAG: prepilin-type N-terminal cleavage/methylation domain-containing protein [Gemmatimonadaceae bacterium]